MADPKYRVIRRIEAGGMAEVYLAEAASLQNFRKRVAIKRVLPHLAQNEKFISMFLDEARLSARLQHANIVTVFDIGTADDTYFIVMEYVDGANLKKLMDSVSRQRGPFPVKEALYIGVEACRGLSYAHELVDEDGGLLGIVHRDISPPNIMITKRGEVKLTDFGLAKASTQLEKTDPGVVKGKFSYLAPEAALGEVVDARADLFSLGVVLWEMLAGRRLFLGETDYQTVKLVQQANVPPLGSFNPEVDAALEQLMGKALARDPRERFGSARDFGDALASYLFGRQLKVTSYDIANLVNGVVNEEPSQRQPMEPSIIDRLIQEELLHFTSIESGAPVDFTPSPLPTSAVHSIHPASAQQPLDAGMFENPAEWFSDDDLGDSSPPVGRSEATDSGWRENGLERLTEDVDLTASEPPPPVPSARRALAVEPGAHLPEAVGAQPRIGGRRLVMLAAVVLIASAVVAWFGKLMSH